MKYMFKHPVQLALRRLLAVLMIAGIVLSGTSAIGRAHDIAMRAHVVTIHATVSSDAGLVMAKMQGSAHNQQLPTKSLHHDSIVACPAGSCALCVVTQTTEAQSPTAPFISHVPVARQLISITAPPPTRPPSAQV